MNDVFTNRKDLVDALMETVNPGPVMVPTIEEQLGALIAPGQIVEFQTESGSHYELICSADMTCTLHKIDDETDGISDVASGELLGIHDRKRGVCGIRIKEASGRTYTTSAITKVWKQEEEPTRVIGMCTACGAIETYLNRATGTRDFSSIGESSAYPTGYGCELCD